MNSLFTRRSLIDPWHPTMITVLPKAEFHLGLFRWDTLIIGAIVVVFIIILINS